MSQPMIVYIYCNLQLFNSCNSGNRSVYIICDCHVLVSQTCVYMLKLVACTVRIDTYCRLGNQICVYTLKLQHVQCALTRTVDQRCSHSIQTPYKGVVYIICAYQVLVSQTCTYVMQHVLCALTRTVNQICFHSIQTLSHTYTRVIHNGSVPFSDGQPEDKYCATSQRNRALRTSRRFKFGV